MSTKYVYFFGKGNTDGEASQKMLLGGKGANLAEMTNIGIPVPPGFTISTDVCTYYYDNDRSYPDSLDGEIDENIKKLEESTGKKFGDSNNALLVSVRSGAAVSMPGMMDTVLNLGLCDAIMPGFIEKTGNERFAYDSYRRFIQMFGNVVMGMDSEKFEHLLEKMKDDKGVEIDTDLDAADLKKLVEQYKETYKKETGEEFPQDPKDQLMKSINAVFSSWNNPRAITYRRLNDIAHDLGTAVNVQAMVFGNMGEDSGTGVAFTRNPANGENKFFGEFLMNAQGEDVVAGIRTPLSIEKLKDIMPAAHEELIAIADRLEKHYKDMQDLEFTIEQRKLYLLQTRNGKRTSFASVKIAVDMLDDGMIDSNTALKRIDPNALPSLLAQIFDEDEKKETVAKGLVISKGLAAGPGAAAGNIAMSADHAVEMAQKGQKVILVRTETSPEDISGMHSAEGILTARGGMTSHAAVVARGMNKPCIVGCSSLVVHYDKQEAVFTQADGSKITLKEGDPISIDGFTGEIINSKIKTIPSEVEQVFILGTKKLEDSELARQYKTIMDLADKSAKLKVRTNADTGEDARVARAYGATGIGLTRTEHMFFEGERILAMREMILSKTAEQRKAALKKILPLQKEDFKSIFKEMEGLAVTIRLLDPPLHEFLPHEDEAIAQVAKDLGVSAEEIKETVEELGEMNPMLGHRGCRLGISHPEITEMQTRAILGAATELKKEGVDVHPEIMVPLVGNKKELDDQTAIIRRVAEEVKSETGVEVPYMLGTMIEVPRAAVTADKIAETAEFFSFGTNDLTQMGAGFSRDDAGKFLEMYAEKGIYEKDPFQSIDQDGIGELVKIAVEKGRKTKPGIKLGICGEHGGDPSSVKFFHKVGLDYVSCSPYRVPVARLAAAQAALED